MGRIPLCLSSHSFPVKQWGFPFPYSSLSYRYIHWNMDFFSLFILLILHLLALLVIKDKKTAADDIFIFVKRLNEHSQYMFTKDSFILSNSIAFCAVVLHILSQFSIKWHQSLQTAPNSERESICCISGLVFTGTLTEWKNRHAPHRVQCNEMQNPASRMR